MFSSDKGQLASQILPQKKDKRKAPKPTYRELLDTEKNLLLNFQFSDNHDYHEHYSDYRAPKMSKTLSFMEKKQLKQNYLQGNFRFFVNPDYEENITYVDPDQEIKWRMIEKVKYITSNQTVCPICLNEHYTIIFPKITRCGHMFCWTCILKYLSYKKAQCPLCDDFLREEDLRTVHIVHYNTVQPGEKVRLKLKKRRKTENTVYNAEDFTEEEDFIRIKRVEWEDILKLREEETRELLDYLCIAELDDKEQIPYIEQGLKILSNDIEKVQKLAAQTRQKKHVKYSEEDVKEHEGNGEEEFLYYYQDIHGLNIFLHPINNKSIKSQFNDTINFPLMIEAPLIEIRGFQQSDVTQRRYKFLNHIPLNSDIYFAEIEMKEFLSPEHLEQLKEEMEIYKQNKKEHPPPPLLSKAHSIQVPSKEQPLPNQGKYKVQFPASPTSLKLNDVHDYPELGAANKEESSAQQGGWHGFKSSKKKSQMSKKGVSDSVLDKGKVLVSSAFNIEMVEELKVSYENSKGKANNALESTLDEWKSVKPDKHGKKGNKR